VCVCGGGGWGGESTAPWPQTLRLAELVGAVVPSLLRYPWVSECVGGDVEKWATDVLHRGQGGGIDCGAPCLESTPGAPLATPAPTAARRPKPLADFPTPWDLPSYQRVLVWELKALAQAAGHPVDLPVLNQERFWEDAVLRLVTPQATTTPTMDAQIAASRCQAQVEAARAVAAAAGLDAPAYVSPPLVATVRPSSSLSFAVFPPPSVPMPVRLCPCQCQCLSRLPPVQLKDVCTFTALPVVLAAPSPDNAHRPGGSGGNVQRHA
jgi:hypothetical protein